MLRRTSPCSVKSRLRRRAKHRLRVRSGAFENEDLALDLVSAVEKSSDSWKLVPERKLVPGMF